jgi:hypothetical protein
LRHLLQLLLGRHTTSVFQLSRCATTKSVLPEGTTLSRQGELKRFPVPVLQDTLAKYLKSVPQFLDKQELEATVQSVREFEKPGGVGQRLQKMLEEKASKSENWVLTASNSKIVNELAKLIINHCLACRLVAGPGLPHLPRPGRGLVEPWHRLAEERL